MCACDGQTGKHAGWSADRQADFAAQVHSRPGNQHHIHVLSLY